jgi:hypothetical protein
MKVLRVALTLAPFLGIAGCGEDTSARAPRRSTPNPEPAAQSSPASVPTSKPTDAQLVKRIDDTVAESQQSGVIHRVDIDTHDVQVNPLVWALWDADTKKAFAVTVAIYCELHGRGHGQYVDVIDSQSAKKLAHYGPLGFEVF